MPTLFYFHVPKTAGTSMISEIREHFAESQVLTDDGNLPLHLLQAYGRARLGDFGFIYGYPGAGVATFLEGVADTVLLLRNPLDHAISNYLSLSRNHAARLHQAARELDFRDFLQANPGILAFQTLSLTTGLGLDVPIDRIFDCLPHVVRYLENSFLVGTVEHIGEFMTSLASIRRWPVPTSLRNLNQVAEDQKASRHSLREIYTAAVRDAQLGTLIAVEQAVYAKVGSIAAAQRERRSLDVLGETARRVWRSAFGEIVLGRNFGQREMIDGDTAWWTLEETDSLIHLRSAMPATLHAEIRIWHAVDPTCVEVWSDHQRLPAMIERNSDGFGILQVSLSDLPTDRLATLTLQIARKHLPNKPPWYPTLLLHRFRLS